MMMHPESLILKNEVLNGRYIQLEPISYQHQEGLCNAANHERVWQYMPHKATKDSFKPWFENCLNHMLSGEKITYVVRSKTCQTILGATAYYNIQLDNRCLALGYSWYIPDVWGTQSCCEPLEIVSWS